MTPKDCLVVTTAQSEHMVPDIQEFCVLSQECQRDRCHAHAILKKLAVKTPITQLFANVTQDDITLDSEGFFVLLQAC